MKTTWDEYVPDSSREFDLCPACVRCRGHSVEEHRGLVAEAQLSELKREESLHRSAEFVYDHDRDPDVDV